MTNSFAGCLGGTQSGAMGEGWSDWWQASYFDNPLVGEYVTGNLATGIRRFAMDANPRTYAELCDIGCQVHSDGEIHASTPPRRPNQGRLQSTTVAASPSLRRLALRAGSVLLSGMFERPRQL